MRGGNVGRLEPRQPAVARKAEVNRSNPELTAAEIDRIIMMAWEDRTSFDAIRQQFGLSPGDVIKLMRREMKANSFKLWRRRTQGRVTKHEGRYSQTDTGHQPRRFRANSQRG